MRIIVPTSGLFPEDDNRRTASREWVDLMIRHSESSEFLECLGERIRILSPDTGVGPGVLLAE